MYIHLSRYFLCMSVILVWDDLSWIYIIYGMFIKNLILFHLKTLTLLLFYGQMDNQIVVSDYVQMDRVLREERAYILNLVKQIKKTGCNVLLIQKSILRCGLFILFTFNHNWPLLAIFQETFKMIKLLENQSESTCWHHCILITSLKYILFPLW